MSRELMSLQMEKPMMRPFALIARASSGSGTFHFPSRRIRTGAPGPATRRGVALKKSSGRAAV
ncbi:hypothetical protein D3C83_335270 [compost metagenome]